MHAENKMCKYGSTCNQRLRFVFLQYAELDDERFTLECAKDSSLNNYIRDTWQVVRSLIVMDDTEAKFRCANTPAASLFLLTLLFVTSLHPIFCAVLFKCPLSFPLQLSFRPTGYPLIIADVVILKSSLLSPPTVSWFGHNSCTLFFVSYTNKSSSKLFSYSRPHCCCL